MFQFFFKYPISVFSKGQFVLLGRWPAWLLLLLIAAGAAALGLLIRSQLPQAAAKLKSWRAGVVWLLESLLIAILLVLLWQPAITVAELSSQQNIIAILLDDSRSMAIADSGSDGKTTREAAAVKALQDGMLAGLQKRFQTRLYRLDTTVSPALSPDRIQPTAAATHISDALEQFATETSGLPVGAVILLSDGAENSAGDGGAGGVDLAAINALRNRRLPVHTIGFGKQQLAHDVELNSITVASRALAQSRIPATFSFHQRGYAGRKTVISVRDGGYTLASREITLGADGATQVETLFFSAGSAGAKNYQFSIAPLQGEENLLNNSATRPVIVGNDKRRILYVEGEPRWEYKFIRRAEEDDPIIEIASMLRTTENKIYRQGISDPSELAEGFPVRPEDLFRYQGILIGSVEASYFTPLQQQLIREFVDRRGGGLLLLGGRYALADGGWGGSSLVDLLPTVLPSSQHTFHIDPATVELTPAGSYSPITRLLDDPAKNVERWKSLTYLMDYQDPGSPKPGATVLVESKAGLRTMPLLVTENYGRGRTAVMATGGTWRWQMSEPLGDPDHQLFWQQLLRWLVTDTPGQVVASSSRQTLTDDGRIQLSADVRDKTYVPDPDAQVMAHIIGPGGVSAMVQMSPATNDPGSFQAEWTAAKPGSYLVEVTALGGAGTMSGAGAPAGDPKIAATGGKGAAGKAASGTELGSDVLTFQRTDGVAEHFHTEQNRQLLQNLAAETGGRYWNAKDLAKLPSEVSYSDAGISVRDTKELWDMPAVFLLLLLLLSAEWLLRRKWGVV